MVTTLEVTYPATYPDAVPDLKLTADEGELTGAEMVQVMDGMQAVGEESIGMAMVFTLTSWLKEELSRVVHERVRIAKEIEDKKFAEAEEVSAAAGRYHCTVVDASDGGQAEAARKRGTPVTKESFEALTKRLREAAEIRRKKSEEDRVRALPTKEREEYKKVAARPTGRQLFETLKTLATSDMQYEEEGVAEVDFSQYSREERDRARQEAEDAEKEDQAVKFYDSD